MTRGAGRHHHESYQLEMRRIGAVKVQRKSPAINRPKGHLGFHSDSNGTGVEQAVDSNRSWPSGVHRVLHDGPLSDFVDLPAERVGRICSWHVDTNAAVGFVP